MFFQFQGSLLTTYGWTLLFKRDLIDIFSNPALYLYFIEAYGSGSRLSAPFGGPRGCCGSCLEDSGEDSFEKAERKERERREKQEAELRNGVAKDQRYITSTLC